MAKFEYWGITVTDLNCIHEEVKNRLNSGNDCIQDFGWKI